MHFGLGDARRVDRLTVSWDRGRQTVMRKLKANRYMTVTPCKKPKRRNSRR